MHKYVLIAAGGKGTRMGSAQAKQFMLLAGKPLLVHAFETFQKYDPNIGFVLVLPEKMHAEWTGLCREHGIYATHEIATGGPNRFHSVKNGLKHIPNDALVAIHDGARPLVSLNLIARVFNIAEKFGNAIPVVETFDSVRLTDHAMSSPLPRERVRLVQTPQCFKSNTIKDAYNHNYKESFTDDASVLETTGERLFLVDGCRKNIKITTKTELAMAEGLAG